MIDLMTLPLLSDEGLETEVSRLLPEGYVLDIYYEEGEWVSEVYHGKTLIKSLWGRTKRDALLEIWGAFYLASRPPRPQPPARPEGTPLVLKDMPPDPPDLDPEEIVKTIEQMRRR